MFYKLLLNSLCCSVLTLQVWAAPKDKPVTHYMSIATANSLNRFGTIDEYTKWLAQFAPKGDIEKLKLEFAKYGLKPGTKFPKFKYKDNKVFIDKNNSIVYPDNASLVANGKKIVFTKKTIHEIFADTCIQIGCKATNSADYSLIPKAHALYGEQTDWGNVIAGGAIGAGINYLINGKVLWGGLIGGLAGAFINNENNYACNYNDYQCNVTCNNGDYYIDRPNNNTNYYGQNYGPSYGNSGRVRIYPDTVRQSYGNSYVPCNSGNQVQQDQLAYDIRYGGYGRTPGYQDRYIDEGYSPVYSNSNNGANKRGTTSLPTKE